MKTPKCLNLLLALVLTPIFSFAQVQTCSFMFEGVLRTYIVYLPQNYNGIDEVPLVFNLHGYTLNAQQQMEYSLMNTVADSEGFIVVYPNAAGIGWNCGINGSPNINDVGFINALIDTLARHYRINEEMIYSCGFSLGGFMSNRLACELSSRIAAIASVGGTMAQSTANGCNPDHPMPVLLIHGTNDLIVPFNGAYDWLSVQQTLNHWNNFNGCTESDTISLPNVDTLDGCTVQRITFTHCTDSVCVILFKVINGGHSWPGGDTNKLHLTWGVIGKTNGDINASQTIWNFFKDNSLLVGVEQETMSPERFVLFQNYPNPFNPSTTIKFELPKSSMVRLSVYNILGQEVATLVNENKSAGVYTVQFDGSNLASGVYFYRLEAGGFVATKKIVVLK